MKLLTASFCALAIVVTPLALRAQTATWTGTGGSLFSNAANWSPASVPNGGTADLVFGITTNTFVSFNSLPVTINGITFTSSATNQFFLSGNGGILTIGAGGVETESGSGGAFFNLGLNVALGANQTWTTASDITVQSNISGSGMLTKDGSGSLITSGINSYTGGTTVTAGTLHLGTSNSSTGTVSVGSSGTLGTTFYDVTLANAISLADGATLGGSANGGDSFLELTGTVSLGSTSTTLNIGSQSDVFFGGTVTGSPGTALTVQSDGTGVAILGGTQSNITSMIANNAAIAFGNSAALPTTSIQATNGGYVSVAEIGGTTPTVAALMALITDKTNFNGVLGFDTDEDANNPHVFSDAISLAGFTNGNVRLGSLTSATLTGVITPVGQSYDFGGFAAQDGLLVVKSDLTELNATTTNVSLVSPSASGGAPQNGMVLILQGAGNNFTGDINVSYSSLILDSALPATADITLGAYSYAGFTEGSGLNFSTLATRVANGGYTATSILGIDSQDVIDAYVDNGVGTSQHTITGGALNLGGFTSIYLGTLTGATISTSTVITTPTDNTLRLVNMGDSGGLIIQRVLNHSGGVVAGMAGSEGAVILAAQNTYSGGTTLLGGQLLVGDTSTTALGSGALTVAAPGAGDMPVLATAMGSASLANNISVAESLQIGTGDQDDNGRYLADTTSLTLSGVISGAGQLHVTGLTTLSGANSYGGGTFVLADTTVSHNTGLGTGAVYLGSKDSDSDGNSGNGLTPVRATLNFTTTAPSIGSLFDASMFVFNGGTGNINMGVASTTLTINQTTGSTYTGQFTGNTFALVKNGSGQLSLTGNNAGQIASTTIGAGSLAIGNSSATTATFGGDVTINATGAGTGLFFRPGSAQTMTYSGSISGAGSVTVNGFANATTSITGGSSTFTGNTTVQSGKLQITGDNYWSATSPTTVQINGTLQLDGNQTIRNLSGGGTVNLAGSGKTLTVNSASNTSFIGTVTGAGGLTKTGASSFTISGTNSYTGSTLVSAGTLTVNSALASQSVTVDAGAFLMGTGTLNDLTLHGTYRPGANTNAAALVSLDSLTMVSTGLIHMEIGGLTIGSQFDSLNITGGSGAFNVDGTLTVTLFNGFNPSLGNSFNLFDFTSLTGTFDTLNLQGLSGGLAWDTSALYTTGVLSVTTAPIPEPATTAAMAGLAVFGLAVWRRRFTKRFQGGRSG